MSECDLCSEKDEILYPLQPRIGISRHICGTCVDTIQKTIKIPQDY